MDKITIDSMYKSNEYLLTLNVQHWFTTLFEYDPVTDEPLATDLDTLTYKITQLKTANNGIFWWNDRLEKIVNYTKGSLYELFDELHKKNVREHLVSHSMYVREIDSTCIRWLSKKPGRTIKQKIGVNQKMLGVYHATSIDTAENRLLKVFAQELDTHLYQKEKALLSCELSDDCELFLRRLHQWLKSDEARAIGQWNNTPPNNTLLNHKHYRKIWKAWLRLQALPEILKNDFSSIQQHCFTVLFWKILAKIQYASQVRLCQQPLFFQYEKNILGTKPNANGHCKIKGFITTDKKSFFKLSLLLNWTTGQIEITVGEKKHLISVEAPISDFLEIETICDKTCKDFFPDLNSTPPTPFTAKECAYAVVDVTSIKPHYFRSEKAKQKIQLPYLMEQFYQFKADTEVIHIPCFYSKMLQGSSPHTSSIQTITMSQILASTPEVDDSVVNDCLTSFSRELSKQLQTKKCIYLIPDSFDDFSSQKLRKTMNSTFNQAMPLPRSVSAVFFVLQDPKFKVKDGMEIRVIDTFDSFRTETNIKIIFDKELLEKNPESKGYKLERYPPIRTDFGNQQGNNSVLYPDKFPEQLKKTVSKNDAFLLADNFTFGDYHFTQETCTQIKLFELQQKPSTIKIIQISQKTNTTLGASFLEKLQQCTPDIPLWKDHLPNLAFQWQDENRKEKTFYLVNDNTVIEAKIGQSIQIPITNTFLLPAGNKFYEFPLIRGKGKNIQQFFAYMKHDSFPLATDTECTLYLTYTYGAENSYQLVFKSLHSEQSNFNSVKVIWTDKSHKDWLHLPYPDFGKINTWSNMTKYPKLDKEEYSDCTGEWLPTEFKKLENLAEYDWNSYTVKKRLPSGTLFLNKKMSNGKDLVCYEDKLKPACSCTEGDIIFCSIIETSKGFEAFDPCVSDQKLLQTSLNKSLRFPLLTVWNHGKSLQDTEVPQEFKNICLEAIDNALEISINENCPQVIRDEMYFFFSCLHKDAPKAVVTDLFNSFFQDEYIEQYHRNIGFAIGDCSQDWQKQLLQKTLSLLNTKNKKYGFTILAVSLWRVSSLVENFTHANIEEIISSAIELFIQSKKTEIKTNPQRKDIEISLVRVLETLLAIFRRRNTTDETLLKLLSPKKSNIEKLNEQLLPLDNYVRKINFKLKSRISFAIKKTDTNKTPELLYAVQQYAQGNLESNSIRVLSVSDDEND